MADILHRTKTCLILAGAALLLLTGCAGRPLIEREIVRAVFFAQQEGKSHVVLLLQDQESEDSSDYKTATGEGDTAAQALSDAAAGLDGVMFYGLTNLVALPPDCNWEELRQFASVLYETAQPSPEITLFLLDNRTVERLQETAGDLYDTMQAVEKKYRISCGLESVLSQSDQAALPCWQEEGYGFAVLKQGQSALRYVEPMRAQLTAVLRGQSRQMEFTFEDGNASCRAGATVLFGAERNGVEILLQLHDSDLSALTDAVPRQEEALEQLLAQQLETAFSQIYEDTQKIDADPFRLTFWQNCLLGSGEADFPVNFRVEYT